MKRRLVLLGASALLLTAVAAEAQGWGDGGRHGRGGHGAGLGYGGYGGAVRRPWYDGGAWRAQPVYGFQDRRGGGYGSAPPRGYGGGYRRGQVLPPGARDAYVPDPGRYHLRAAPPGYGWVGDGRNAYLTQRSTGMVLDAVPGAYDPPPYGQGRGRGRRGPR